MCSLRFENNLLTVEGVRFASISKKTPLLKLSFAFVSLALPLLFTSCSGGAYSNVTMSYILFIFLFLKILNTNRSVSHDLDGTVSRDGYFF